MLTRLTTTPPARTTPTPEVARCASGCYAALTIETDRSEADIVADWARRAGVTEGQMLVIVGELKRIRGMV